MKKLGIAAQLAKRREPAITPLAAEEEEPKIAAPIEAAADTNGEPLLESPPASAALAGGAVIHEAWEPTKLGAIAQKKKPGPQRRPGIFQKRIFTLDSATSDYVNHAWRSYRTRDGHLVDSMSEFVAAVLAEHRDRNGR